MKQEHKIIAAVVALVLLGVGVYMSRRKTGEREQEHAVTAAKDLPPIKIAEADGDKITKIVIENKDKGDVTLEKKGEKWELTKPMSAPANEQNIKSLIDNAKKIELQTVIADTAEVHGKYDLTDDKALHAQLFRGKDKVLDLYFGKGGSRGQMVRMPGKDTVYAAKGYSSFAWAREPHNWREKEILKFDDKKALSVEVENEHGKFVFTRKEKAKTEDKKDAKKDDKKDDKKEAKKDDKPKDVPAKDDGDELDEDVDDAKADQKDAKKGESDWEAWFFERDEKSGKLAAEKKKIDRFDGKKVDDLLRAYKALNATNFADAKADTGVDDPLKNGGGIVRIKLKDKTEYELKVGKKHEGSNRYLAKEGDSTVYVVTSWAADWATAKVDKFQKAEEKAKEGGDGEEGDDEHAHHDKEGKKDDKAKATVKEEKKPAPKAPAPGPAPKPAAPAPGKK